MKEYVFEVWRLPRELELMLRIALRQSVEAIPEDLDWERFEALLDQHRIQPLLIRGLRQMDGELVDAFPVLKKLRGQQNQYAMRSMTRLQALSRINAAFADAGIRMISMKGPLLAMELYGDPSLRTSRDLDLMVSEEDLPRAGEILREMGYALEPNPYATTPLRHKFYRLVEHEKHEVYNKGDICIELHWKSDYQAEQSFEELWQSREEQILLGRSIALMGPEDRYPALMIHAAEHGFLRLRWLLDLYELQKKPKFSWAKTYAAMRERGVGELLLETLLVLYRLDLPGLEDLSCQGFAVIRENGCVALRVLEEHEQDAEKAKLLSDAVYPLLLRQVGPTEPEWKAYDRYLPTAIFGKSALQRVLLALGPTKYEFELIDLPDWLFWLYFIIRPFNWLRRKLFGGKK